MNLLKQGLLCKEAQSLVSHQRRVRDLYFLQNFEGPFSRAEDVNRFMCNNDVTDETKSKVMYHQVRFARNTSLSLSKCSEVFRLMKKHHRLQTVLYANNLKTYLSKVQSKSTATWEDFDKAVNELAQLIRVDSALPLP